MPEPEAKRAPDADEPVDEMEAIVAAHEKALLRYAFSILNDRQATQDVVQNVFMKLIRRWSLGFRPLQPIRGWLLRVTHNEAVDYYRRESRLRRFQLCEAEAQTADPPPRDNPAIEEAERMRMVLAHIDKLSFGERQVLVLRLQEGLAYEDISRVTGRSVGNVGCLLHNAVKKLGQMLRAENPAPADGLNPAGGKPTHS